MEVSGQLHVQAALPSRERAPGFYWVGGCMGPRTSLEVVEKRKNFSLPWIEPQLSSPLLYELSYADSQ
jgi:hypothetical protein